MLLTETWELLGGGTFLESLLFLIRRNHYGQQQKYFF